MKTSTVCLITVSSALYATAVFAEQLGAVNYSFQLLGKSNQIIVEVFDDPKVAGVSCFLSRAVTGGLGGAIGIAQNKSDTSVSCRNIGDIVIREKLPQQEEIFTEKTSLLFKHARVIRIVDPKRHTLVYMSYTDRLIDGSPKNSVTAVPLPKEVQLPSGSYTGK
jgi:CreA protein